MKVLFVQSPANNIRYNVSGSFRVLPLGIAYIARKLKDKNIDLEFFYSKKPRNFLKEFQRHLYCYGQHQIVVGIYATLFSAREAFRLAQIAKSVNSKAITIIGGPITSFSARSIFKYSEYIDFIISGEADNAFAELVSSICQNRFKNIPNISYKLNTAVISNEEKCVEDLDSLGMPLREVFPKELYGLHPPMGRYAPAFLVETIRGCDFSCEFCSLTKNVRMRSISMVIEELTVLKKVFKAKEVHFIDPTFSLRKERTYELCSKMIQKKIKIPWSCKTRVDCVDEELIRVMKEAGCYMIHFGVESPRKEILDSIEKNQTANDSIAAFNACNKFDIKTGAFMLIASTGYENKQIIEEAMRFVKKIRPTFAFYDKIKPIPNSSLANKAKEANIISQEDIETFYLGDKKKSKLDKITISDISQEKASQWVSRASQSFYLSLNSILRIIRSLRTTNDWINSLKGGIIYLFDIIRKDVW